MWPFTRSEKRSLENPSVPISSPDAYEILFGESSAAGEAVNAKTALSVPAVWAAVNFLSSTIAGLPLNLYKRASDGRERADADPLYRLLHDAPNDEWTSYRWRKYSMQAVLINGGRSYTWIQRNGAGGVSALWPLDPSAITVGRALDDATTYTYQLPNKPQRVFNARDVLDVPFMLEADQITHVNPVNRLRRTIGLTIALESYAARHFENGGVPPLSLEGPITTPAAVERAGKDILGALKKARKEGRNILPLPLGHVLKPVGFNPEQSQLESARRFQVEEVARVYSLPPVFLQDLSRSTYSNSEQQDMHFVKHTLGQWLKAWEQEMNLKLFAKEDRTHYVEFNVDGLLRGDFATRMDGLSKGIQNAFLTPNEARAMENRPPKDGGDELWLQQNMARLGQINLGAANDD